MEFFKSQKRIFFKLDGKPFEENIVSCKQFEDGDTLTTVYELLGGLKVTDIAKFYENYGAYGWVNYFENTADENTAAISELWDCFADIPMVHSTPCMGGSDLPLQESATKVYSVSGSDWMADEFFCDVNLLRENYYPNWIFSGEGRAFANRGGRSSQGKAPFFNVYQGNRGFIAAVGWTGQWNAEIIRNADSVTFKSKIEDTEFYLKSGEKIRTSSVTIMCYNGDFDYSQNLWRRFFKNVYCPLNKGQRPEKLPFCMGIWGGMSLAGAVDRIKKTAKAGIPADHFWMDAGRYGMGKLPYFYEFSVNVFYWGD